MLAVPGQPPQSGPPQFGCEQGVVLVHFFVDVGGDSVTLPSSSTENWLMELVDMFLVSFVV